MLSEEKLNNLYHGNDSPSTLGELIDYLSDITERHIHGTRDNDWWNEKTSIEKSEERLRKIRLGYGQLSANCRYVHETTQRLLQQVGIPSRKVGLISGRGSERDARHTVCEVFYDNEHFHVDVDMGVLFTQGTRFMTSLEVVEHLTESRITPGNFWRLTNDKHVDHVTYAYLKPFLDNSQALLQWYANISAAILIGNTIYTPFPERTSSIRADLHPSDASATFVSREEFKRVHYTTPAP